MKLGKVYFPNWFASSRCLGFLVSLREIWQHFLAVFFYDSLARTYGERERERVDNALVGWLGGPNKDLKNINRTDPQKEKKMDKNC